MVRGGRECQRCHNVEHCPTFTLAGLAAPTLSGPSGTITASTGYDMPTFSWSASAGAGHYFLVVVDDNTGGLSSTMPMSPVRHLRPARAQALTPGHSYTWYVLAMSTNSEAYNYLTSGQTFTLAEPDGADAHRPQWYDRGQQRL